MSVLSHKTGIREVPRCALISFCRAFLCFVPFLFRDGGWSARVDGKKQEIIPSGGMMLLRIPAGHHEIEFTYVTPGCTAGKYISLMSIAAFGIRPGVRRFTKGKQS